MADVQGDVQPTITGPEEEHVSMEVEQPEKEEEVMEVTGGGGIWGGDDPNHEDLEPSMFLDEFPPLPDFSCMSPSSSTASTPAPAKPILTSAASSSTASWVFMKAGEGSHEKGKEDLVHAEQDLVGTGDGGLLDMDYLDLLDSNEIWDPSSIFQMEGGDEEEVIKGTGTEMGAGTGSRGKEKKEAEDDDDGTEALGLMFFEWLRANKEYISVEDMRTIKLRKATIESASRRLGSSKEGKKQLLKLILEWVEQFQLNKNRPRVINEVLPNFSNPSTSTWMAPQPLPPPQMQHYPVSPAMIGGYMGSGSGSGSGSGTGTVIDPYANYTNIPAQMWTQQPAIGGSFAAAAYGGGGGNFRGNQSQYPYPAPSYYPGLNGEKMVRPGPSATKEARQKRMARQRKNHSHLSRYNRNHNQHKITTAQNVGQQQQQIMMGMIPNANPPHLQPHPNWVYWGQPAPMPLAPAVAPAPVMPPVMPATDHASTSTQRRQGIKTEKNLRFLLQKVLKQSDVGSLGRIVLPKKEAETHLPELEARDGITLPMEDIGTSRIWNMRYRYWPNNKSRMYLLENTGEFVRLNALQEGDFIVIYSDIKCGKYLIRGVKVRQPDHQKAEGKKVAKGRKNNQAQASVKGKGKGKASKAT